MLHSEPRRSVACAMDNPESAGNPQQMAAMVERAEAGDADARDVLFASLYRELHAIAESHLRRSGGHLTRSDHSALFRGGIKQ